MNRIPGNLARLGAGKFLNPLGQMTPDFGGGLKFIHLGQGTSGSFQPSKVRVEKGQVVKWCACGMSSKQPFCDGSHTKSGAKTPITFKATETKEYFFCNCKKTGKSPFCDGTHAK